jgi:phenylpropionate dioxygenase-like ring-hydroxylating dioxygenase large terminal subunit
MLELQDRTARIRLPQDERREQLMDAAVLAIAEHGLSNATLGKVAEIAGVAPSMVNFQFESKQALFEATLERLLKKIHAAYLAAVESAGDSPVDQLLALGTVCFEPHLATRETLATWYAFRGDVTARQSVTPASTSFDAGFYELSDQLVAKIVRETGSKVDVQTASLGYGAMVDLCWWTVLLGHRSLEESKALCRTYLTNLFPDVYRESASASAPAATEPGRPDAFRRLAAWTYTDRQFAEQERTAIHMPAWHSVCHVNEIQSPGSYVTLNVLGKRAMVVRGEDGVIRAFHNVCRHRGHEVVQGRKGNCGLEMRCPFHGWVYSTTGTLLSTHETGGVTGGEDVRGLAPIECEIFNGFVFLRFKPEGLPVAERFAPFADVLARYRMAEMVPDGPFQEVHIAADWKNVWDNYLEYDVYDAVHPQVRGLMVHGFDVEVGDEKRVLKIGHTMRERVEGPWSIRAYASLLPEATHLPPEQRRRWSYYYLYPFVSMEIFPDMVAFVHVTPAGPGRSLIRWRRYSLPNADRAMRATRWLNHRINSRIEVEDMAHAESVQRNLESGDYEPADSNERDANLMALHDWVRADMPSAR